MFGECFLESVLGGGGRGVSGSGGEGGRLGKWGRGLWRLVSWWEEVGMGGCGGCGASLRGSGRGGVELGGRSRSNGPIDFVPAAPEGMIAPQRGTRGPGRLVGGPGPPGEG